MSEMVERVAKAMWEKTYTSPWRSKAAGDDLTQEYLDMARAAIEALREPTEAMRRINGSANWQAMIDKALK